MYTSPGYAVKGWTPPTAEAKELERVQELHRTGQIRQRGHALDVDIFYEPRWCPSCQSFKPPRSHHCSELKLCVLKLDHYCPWVYNAVGYRNHKFFFQFLFYASVSLIYFLICCIVRVVLVLRNYSRYRFPFTTTEIVLLIIQLVLTLPVTIGIASLFFYQLSCMWNNQTSVETFAYRRFKRGARLKNNKAFRWFYDYGVFNNLKDVLGHTLVEWFIPVVPEHVRTSDGTLFKTRPLHEVGGVLNPLPAQNPASVLPVPIVPVAGIPADAAIRPPAPDTAPEAEDKTNKMPNDHKRKAD